MISVKPVRVLVIGSVVAAVSLASLPASAEAFRGHSSGSRGHSSGFRHKGFTSSPQKSVFPQPVDPWKFWPPRQHHHVRGHHGGHHAGGHHFGGHQVFGGVVGGGSVIVNETVVAASAPTLVTAVPGPLPATLPTATLVEYPTGWYQLRGDGVNAPYVWVWIPKPPAAPAAPEPPPPPLTPLSSAPAEPSARGERGPAYHWSDEGGVTTWTNRLDRVPKRYRDQAAASVE